ncbi:MAG TPA: histidinol dehydrogenase [Ignavibacteria bacterium]
MKVINSYELPQEFFSFKDTQYFPIVREILYEVKTKGDIAIKHYTNEFDKVKLDSFVVTEEEIKSSYSEINKELIPSIKKSIENIEKFSVKQLESFKDFEYEISPGVITGQKVIPIERIGVYIPGGRFPLVSTVLMCVVPAKVANVNEIAIFSPPTFNGKIHPAILVACDLVGVKEIYKIGGVQAIGAMAYGTESIKKVDKIVGPGNKFVALAKKEVYGITGIDFIAGPTEVLIIADECANPKFVASDLIAQAEHDPDAQPILITTNKDLVERVIEEIETQLDTIPTKEIAEKSIKNNGLIIIAKDYDEAIYISNKKAPEHLEIDVKNISYFVSKLRNYGSLFIGSFSAESLGDYSSGINHTLPTNFAARYTGGLSVKDFIKIQTTLYCKKENFNEIADIAITLAETEGLFGHSNSLKVRKNYIQ